MEQSFNKIINDLTDLQVKLQDLILIGVAGVPGVGKTYFCQEIIKKQLPNIAIIPMDGYHKYRSELDEEGLKKRGAPFTFHAERFRRDLERLKKTGEGKFPAFEHHLKDPIEDVIIVSKGTTLVFVEGLYLFLKEWETAHLFDYKILLNGNIEKAGMRCAYRHMASGIVKTLEEGIRQAQENDTVNGKYVLENSDFNNTQFVEWD